MTLEVIEGRSFVSAAIDARGKRYEDCTFIDCTITVPHAAEDGSIAGCEVDGCNITAIHPDHVPGSIAIHPSLSKVKSLVDDKKRRLILLAHADELLKGKQ